MQLSGEAAPQSSNKAALLRTLSRTLGDNFDNGLYCVVIIDEAQSIEDRDLIEEIRLLLNIQRDDTVLFTLVLLGQNSFIETIQRLPQLRQRLSLRYYMRHLGVDDVRQYIHHRLRVAGLDKDVFSESACSQVFSLSKGIPRVINNLCDLALLTGFIKQQETIDKAIVSQAGKDLQECFSGVPEQKDDD